MTARSAGTVRPASSTSTTASTSARLCVTARFIRSFRRERWRVWKPGVSTKMNCASAVVRMPVTRCRVVCAFFDVMLILSPTRRLRASTCRRSGGRRSRRDRSGIRRRRLSHVARLPAAASRSRSAVDAAACSAARRLAPVPVAAIASAGMRHSTVKVCACASPATCGHDVLRHGDPPRLQPLLQPRLRVLRQRRGIEIGQDFAVDALDHRRVQRSNPASRKTAPNTASSASARIDGRSRAAALLLRPRRAGWQRRGRARAEAGQRLAIDETRAHARQLAFGNLRKPPVEDRGDRAVQHRVADELEPLVVLRAEAAVRERLAQQLRAAERVTQPVTQRVGRHPSAALAVPVSVSPSPRTRDRGSRCRRAAGCASRRRSP